MRCRRCGQEFPPGFLWCPYDGVSLAGETGMVPALVGEPVKPNPLADKIEAALRAASGTAAEPAAKHRAEEAATHLARIQAAPFGAAESYRALRRIYLDAGLTDRAYCLCATLSFLKLANEEERQAFERDKPHRLLRARSVMNDELWHRYLMHPDQNRFLGAIFALLAPTVSELMAKPPKQFGLKPKNKREVATDQLLFSKAFSYVTTAMRVPQAALYVSGRDGDGLRMANTSEGPAFVVGKELLSGQHDLDLIFAIGRQLAYLRPEHILARVLPGVAPLRVLLLTALKLAGRSPPLAPADVADVEALHKRLGPRLEVEQIDQLAGSARQLLTGGAPIDIEGWFTAVELTAIRAGMVLCTDLSVAARMICAEPVRGRAPQECLAELVYYSVSEEYLTLRARLGISI